MDLKEFEECCDSVCLDVQLTEEEQQNFLKRILPDGDVKNMTELEKRALADKVADAAAEALVEMVKFM